MGTVLLTATTYSYPVGYSLSMSSEEVFLALSLILIAIGTGGIDANTPPMGADLVRAKGAEKLQEFFSWYFWFIMIGMLLGCSIVAYVQQEVSFFYGYLITSVSIVLAAILLRIGRKHYKVHPPQGSYLIDTLRIIGGGLRDKLYHKKSPSLSHWLDGAKVTNGGEYPGEMVEGVKSVVRLIPIFVTFMFYFIIDGQVNSALLLFCKHNY